MRIDIYTDGSHLDKQNNGRLGCGGVMIIEGKKIDEFSMELKPEWLKSFLGIDKVSNPSAELLGVLMALRNFKLDPRADIYIHADYIGVKQWMEGAWKIKEPYIKIIKDEIDSEIKAKKIKPHFLWVKGHQNKSVLDPDARWNNYVDLLAKGENYVI